MAAPRRGLRLGLTPLRLAWRAHRAQYLETGICVGLTLAGLEACSGLGAPLEWPPPTAQHPGGTGVPLSVYPGFYLLHQPSASSLEPDYRLGRGGRRARKGFWGDNALTPFKGSSGCPPWPELLPCREERQDGLPTTGACSAASSSRMGLGGEGGVAASLCSPQRRLTSRQGKSEGAPSPSLEPLPSPWVMWGPWVLTYGVRSPPFRPWDEERVRGCGVRPRPPGSECRMQTV